MTIVPKFFNNNFLTTNPDATKTYSLFLDGAPTPPSPLACGSVSGARFSGPLAHTHCHQQPEVNYLPRVRLQLISLEQ